jgi:hypothetical protein
MTMRKSIYRPSAIALLIILAFSCSEQEITPWEASCMTFLLGDKDGFGFGLSEGEPWVLPGGTALPIDYRSSGDPVFTDIYPADMAESEIPSHQIVFTVNFTKPSLSIASATLRFSTAGIQDGDAQVVGSDTDVTLYVDDHEIPNAFDQLDQFDFMNGNWADFASTHELEIPNSLLPVFRDGKVVVRMEILNLNPDSQSFDGFAIDYCELKICVESQQQ